MPPGAKHRKVIANRHGLARMAVLARLRESGPASRTDLAAALAPAFSMYYVEKALAALVEAGSVWSRVEARETTMRAQRGGPGDVVPYRYTTPVFHLSGTKR